MRPAQKGGTDHDNSSRIDVIKAGTSDFEPQVGQDAMHRTHHVGLRRVARTRGREPHLVAHACGTIGQHEHAVGELCRLLDVVRHEHHGAGLHLQHASELQTHPQPRQVVERRERLVHQQQIRVAAKRAGQLGALTHAARELVRIVRRERAQTNEVEERLPAAAAVRRVAQVPQPEIDVLADRHPRKETVLLKHHAQPLRSIDAPGGRLEPAGAQVEQRGFAAARRPHERDELAMRHRERNVGNSLDAAEAVADAGQRQERSGAGRRHLS